MKVVDKGTMNAVTFSTMFNKQAEIQREMLKNGMYDRSIDNGYEESIVGLPIDRPVLASYHIQQLISEIGEVLEADKRWKNIRRDKYNKDAKAEELADCFIVLMNICMFSGLTAEDMVKAIMDKQIVVEKRVEAEK